MRPVFGKLWLATGLLALLGGNALAHDRLSPFHFQSQGLLGSTDKAAAQRGFLVYETVCASCHTAKALHYRDLEALGLTPDQVAGIAAGVKTANGAPATLNDTFPAPKIPAGAFGGAVPPDLSDIAAQRPHGARYIDHLLTGYAPAPAGVTLLPSYYYNTAYPGGQLAMPPPLKADDVTYADGKSATVAQQAADVSEFLAWSADPNLDARHEVGLRAVLFLVFLTIIAIASKRRIWRETV